MTEENICPSCHRPLPPDAPGGLCPACVLMGAREEAPLPGMPDIDQVRAAFPQFEILECIGRGGMGAVYKARQPQLDRMVALKILLPGLERDPGFAERFAREARALAKLNHPNIVAVHDFGETGGFFWLTMEYVDGVNLRQAMQAARFTPAQALAIIPELCSALQYAHDHGILHRDIKPENILLDARGKVKVADFGIARMAGDERLNPTLTMTGAALGTAAYVAPEQIENPRAVDHRADLYSLGVVLYEMLTGELPLGRFPAPSERSASDPRLDEVVFRSLEKQPEKRYQQAEEFSNRVSGVAATSPPPTPAGPQAKVSATAVAAAAATAFSVVLGLPYLSNLGSAHASGRRTGFTTLDLLVILVGIVAPALTGMILGAVSWARIKDSAGALRGARLAQSATLAWPVLMLLAVLPGRQIVIAGLLLAGIIYFIVRTISRAVTRARRVDNPSSQAQRVAPSGLPRAEGGPSSSTLIAASIGSILVGSILLGFGMARITLFLVPGLCFAVLGVSGGWWALWRMKQGTSSTVGYTALRIFAVWLPVLAISGFLVMSLMDHGLQLFPREGCYFVNLAVLYVVCFAVARMAFGLSALPGKRHVFRPWLTGGVVVLVLALAATSLVIAKQRDSSWPTAHFLAEQGLDLEEPAWKPGQDSSKSQVQEALEKAAGEYRDKIQISNVRGYCKISILAKDEHEANAHLQAFLERLAITLPLETWVKRREVEWFVGAPAGSPAFLRQDHKYPPYQEIYVGCLIPAAASAVLAGWCLAPLSLILAGLSLAAGAGLAAVPVPEWVDPQKALLIEGPPLPPLERRVPAADFSTPVSAAQSVFNAAWTGDMETMKRGISSYWRKQIDERNKWEIVMKYLAMRGLVTPTESPFTEPTRSRIAYGSHGSSGTLNMKQEDGEWRLDDMPFMLDGIR